MSGSWAVGAATGVGSLPGTDPLAAATLVLGALTVPHVPELPARGVGADAVGRTAALLVDLPVEVVASGWQVAARPGADIERARQLLVEDLAALEVAARGWAGPLKTQVVGPLTLAASLGQARGEAAVADRGLLRDLSDSLAEGVRAHLAELAVRVPGARLLLQVDEPSLPGVLAGVVPTRSGWGRLRPVDAPAAEQALRTVLDAAPHSGALVHCCARGVPVALVRGAGAAALSFDLDLLGDDGIDACAEAVDDGLALVVGAVPTSRVTESAEVADRVRALWSRLGFGPDVWRERTVVAPACGLAGMSDERARRAYRVTQEAARRLAESDDTVAP